MQVFFTKESLDQDGPNVRHVRETFEACDREGYALACETLATLDTREQTKKITAPALIQPAQEHIRPCGTGKGIIIITS